MKQRTPFIFAPTDLPFMTASQAPPSLTVAANRWPRRVLWALAAVLLFASGLLFRAHLVERREIAALAAQLAGPEPITPEERLIRYTEYSVRELRNPSYEDLPKGWVRFYYRFSPFHPGPMDVVRWGSDYRGGCGSHTRVVVAMLQASGMQARPLLLTTAEGRSLHTVVQTNIEGRWVVSDALFGIVFRTSAGRLATAEDVAADTSRFWAQVRDIPLYDHKYVYEHVTLMNWKKIPVILPAIRKLAVLVAGESRVDQFVRPSIWMWPRLAWGVICLTLAALAAFAASRVRSGAR